MSAYIHFTDEQKQRANEVDLEEFLACQGEKLLPSGRDKRLAKDRSITIRGNKWFDHETNEGGHAISFVQKVHGSSYQKAISTLLGNDLNGCYPAYGGEKKLSHKPFELPEANQNMRRVFAYLMKQRCIDRQVLVHFARARTLYEDRRYHNCVFVGTDEQGVPRHAHKRSTNSKGKAFCQNVESSDPHYSFHHIGSDGKLYVFEAPIDMLSYITIHPEAWQRHSYVACCGTSSIPVLSTLSRISNPREVFLCLDNDAAGHAAAKRMEELIRERFQIESARLIPALKDWNEDLVRGIAQKSGVQMQ